ncbi:MAG: hypothetical protein ACRD5L_03590 [Bryobacteraceae bacterium]
MRIKQPALTGLIDQSVVKEVAEALLIGCDGPRFPKLRVAVVLAERFR